MKKMIALLALITLLMATGTAMACGVQNPEDCPRANSNVDCDVDSCLRHEGSANHPCQCPYHEENYANNEGDSDASAGGDGTSDESTSMSMGLIAGAIGLPAVLGYAYSRRR
ncbi:MAG: hypothetical protein ACLFVI_06580 [Archaeoglobaceae archaeon]